MKRSGTTSRCCFYFLWTLVLWKFVIAETQKPNPQADGIAPIVDSVRSRNFDATLQLSRAALKKDPRDYRIWTLRGMAYAGKGILAPASEAYEHALDLNTDYLPALEGAAQTKYQQGSPDAKQAILRVLKHQPGDPTSLAMLGFLEYRSDECSDAITHLEKVEQALASQPIVLAAYASCLARDAQYERAIPLLKQALASAPTAATIRLNVALAEWKANRLRDALATLQPAVDENVVDALLLAADIHEAINETQQAVELLRRAILANPKNLSAYLDFANLSYDHSSMQVGIDIVSVGIKQLPDEERLYLVRGILFTQLGKYEDAAQDFGTANRLNPQLSVIGAAEGLAASQQRNLKEAVKKFRAAVKAHPDDALTNYLLADALSEESPEEGTSEYKEELAAIQHACELDPSMTAAHDLLASIYLQEEHLELALEQSRTALQYDPKDQQALYHSVLALRKTGDKAQVAALLKELALLRTATQTEHAQNKRYQLEEVAPVNTLALHP